MFNDQFLYSPVYIDLLDTKLFQPHKLKTTVWGTCKFAFFC